MENNLENQQASVQEPAQEPVKEPVKEPAVNDDDISTKEALAALGRNAKKKAKETWEWAKPKLKVIATVGAIMGVGAYAYSELTRPEMSESDIKKLEPKPVDMLPYYEQEPIQEPMQEPMQGPVMEPAQVTENVVNPE